MNEPAKAAEVWRPIARKEGEGWRALVAYPSGKTRVVSLTVLDSPTSALLLARLWISSRLLGRPVRRRVK